MRTKEEIRRAIRKMKRQRSALEMQEMSECVLSKLEVESHFIAARVVLLYYALPDEVRTWEFLERWYRKKMLLLPKVQGQELSLHPYQGTGSLQAGAFGIMEPQSGTFTETGLLDVAVIPGMAFDTEGNRLGRGRGFYDRFLSAAATPALYKIGIAFPFQIVEDLPVEATDIKMDLVLY